MAGYAVLSGTDVMVGARADVVAAQVFVSAAGIGIVFGYVPARRAARLDPIEALRHE